MSTLKQRWSKVVQCWKTVLSTLCDVGSTLFQRRTTPLYQSCTMLKIQRQVLFHFQRRIRVISTLIYNVQTRFIIVENLTGIEPPLLSCIPASCYKFHALLVHLQPIFTTLTVAGAFGIKPNICKGILFANIVNLLRPLAIFTGKLHPGFSRRF